jgi:hypothetical protein
VSDMVNLFTLYAYSAVRTVFRKIAFVQRTVNEECLGCIDY